MPSKNTKIVVSVDRLESTCFVIMPFAATYQTLYERILKPAIEDAGLTAIRADEVFSKAQITHEIWTQLRACRLVLAELTGKNPNVLYEIGLAHAIGKPSIIITRNEDDVPFDLRALRYLFYDTNDPFWGDNLKKQVQRMVKSVVDLGDFGSVLSGIALQGDTTVAPMARRSNAAKMTYDVSGSWQGVFRFSHEEETTAWSVHLLQSGTVLAGTLIATTTTDTHQLAVIQETVSGSINDRRVEFHATAYTFLETANLTTWSLDSFKGELAEDASMLTGTASDKARHRGELVLSRTGSALTHIESTPPAATLKPQGTKQRKERLP